MGSPWRVGNGTVPESLGYMVTYILPGSNCSSIILKSENEQESFQTHPTHLKGQIIETDWKYFQGSQLFEHLQQ